jgi:hypothetical protein
MCMTASGDSDKPVEQSQTATKTSPLSILGVLRVLVETKKAKTTKDLIRYATQAKAKKDVVDRLVQLDGEGVGLELAYDTISVHLRLEAHRSNSAIMKACQGKKIALILPVPPHVVSLFESAGELTMVMSGEGHLSGFYEHYQSIIKHGARASREALRASEVVVFEGFREHGKVFAETATAELLESIKANEGIQIVAHFRAHKSPDDVEITIDAKRVSSL